MKFQNNESFGRTRTCLSDFCDEISKPSHSHIAGGQYEILVIDDDSIHQVIHNIEEVQFNPHLLTVHAAFEQMVVQNLLAPLGFLVVCALDGAEGLKLLSSREHLPDLILLDFEMPVMSGREVRHPSYQVLCPAETIAAAGVRGDQAVVRQQHPDHHAEWYKHHFFERVTARGRGRSERERERAG